MIDLTATSDAGNGTLATFGVKRDGKATNALLFNLRLAFAVSDETDADKVDRILRGARPYFEANRDRDDVGAINIKPSDCAGNIKLIDPDSGTVLVDAVAEVRKVEMKKAAKVFQYLVDLTLSGLSAVAASHLAEKLDERLTISWDTNSAQQSLPFHAPKTSNAVQIVTAEDGSGGYRFGVQTGLDGDRILCDNFGQSFEVGLDVVISKVIVGPESPDDALLDVAAPYAEQMREAGVAPSWEFVILALADTHGTDLQGAYKLAPAVLAAAVEKARAAVVH